MASRWLSTAFVLAMFAPHPATALDWEIERNFRYFLYPSDVAMQRVARDLYVAEKGASPTPLQLEELMNGGGFWSAKTRRGRRHEKELADRMAARRRRHALSIDQATESRGGAGPACLGTGARPARLGEPPRPRAVAVAPARGDADRLYRDLLESGPAAA